MKYLEFESALRDFPVFSVSDILKCFPKFDNRRLNEWQEKEYIIKVRRGFYCFSRIPKNEGFLYFAANKIYNPSYVSFESGLAYYNLIPEGVFTITSATSRNTASYNTPVGAFDYKHLKPELFFGYRLIYQDGLVFKMAEIEKVLLDYFYLKRLDTHDAVAAIRFNTDILHEMINFEKLGKYQQVFGMTVLDKRIQLFKDFADA